MRVQTSAGPAEIAFDATPDARFLLVVTHGASGGVDTPDLLAVRDAAVETGGVVARVLQPFRVAGARAPGSAVKQDAAWVELVTKLRRKVPGVPLIQGGRSNGARVACRTARDLDAAGVLCLAFPLHPPGKPERSRAEELRDAGCETVVINGDKDPFGVPDQADATLVHVIAGETHSLKKSGAQIAQVVTPWLARWSGV